MVLYSLMIFCRNFSRSCVWSYFYLQCANTEHTHLKKN